MGRSGDDGVPTFDQRWQQIKQQYNAARDIIIQQIPSEQASVQARNRAVMLRKVRTIWLDGVLDQSLDGAPPLDLLPPGAASDPSSPAGDPAAAALGPAGAGVSASSSKIAALFDAEAGELLILGEPGAGKTTLLLLLAQALLERAEQDDDQPMPIVFHLAGWSAQRPPLAAWLIEELNARYAVPRAMAGAWLADQRLLPLLDGLDEVAAEHRAACVAAINTYRRQYGLFGLVVTCRTDEYRALPTPLNLRGRLSLPPLTATQVDAYLAGVGPPLAPLRAALQADPALAELATSPLLLGVLRLVYQSPTRPGPTVAMALNLTGSVEQRRAQLLSTFVSQMVQRQTSAAYPAERTLTWLSWLARGLRQRSRSIFYLDRLQPGWLPTPTALRHYLLLDRGLGAGLGLLVGLLTSLLLWSLDRVNNVDAGFFFVPLCLLIGILFGGRPSWLPSQRRRFGRIVRDTLASSLVTGLTGGLFGGLGIALWRLLQGSPAALALYHGWLYLLATGLIAALFGGLAGGLTGQPRLSPRAVVTADILRWSFRQGRLAAIGGSLTGLIAGGFIGLQVGSPELRDWSDRVEFALWLGLCIGLMSGLLAGLLGGMTGGEVEAGAVPNQAIRRSIRRALRLALLIELLFVLVGLGVGLLLTRPSAGIAYGLLYLAALGLPCAWLGGLISGGYAAIAHLSLRLILWRHQLIPWRYTDFLDHAVDCLFLRRVGGGYLFLHRLLLDYFADRPPAASPAGQPTTEAITPLP
jgi:hypothetical protein